MRACPHCGCSEIDEDAARGDATCTGCGTVIEESIVVSENAFQERAGGSGHTLVGQTVTMERQHGTASGLVSQESREVTHAKGRKLIEEIASQLRINKHCVDTAFNFFKMCVSRSLTRGRLRSHVVTACLYMTCRLENTPHLLLDFSDITQVNVYDLGRTLSFLTRSLRINLPTTDPCLYVLRFAALLDFGDKQKDVVALATRLVQRMKRDWISTGRRPTGLCGAALLLAARSFNFNRTVADVVRVVHISESVVRKRLEEFSHTPSSALTLDQFVSVDLEHCEDPPAFREARRRAAFQRELEEADKIGKDIQPIEAELEKALEKKRREKFKRTPYAKLLGGSLDDREVGAAADLHIRDEIIDTVFRAADDEEEEDDSASTSNANRFGPSLESLGIRHSAGASWDSKPFGLPAQDNEDGDLDLDDINDDEIDSYILTTSEAVIKERVWMKFNGEHMAEMERRRREREEEEAKERENPNGVRKKRKRPNRKKTPINANSAVEAIEKVIQEKKLSNKINYDILKEIEGTEQLAKPSFLSKDEIGLGLKTEPPSTQSEKPGTPVATAPPSNGVVCVPPSESRKRRRTEMKPTVPTAALRALSSVLTLPPKKTTEEASPSPQKEIKNARLSSPPPPKEADPEKKITSPSTESATSSPEKKITPPSINSAAPSSTPAKPPLVRGRRGQHKPIIAKNVKPVSGEKKKAVAMPAAAAETGPSTSSASPAGPPATSESSLASRKPASEKATPVPKAKTNESSKTEEKSAPPAAAPSKSEKSPAPVPSRRSRLKPVIPAECLWRSSRNKK